jgi:hypothetical protein
MAIGLIASLSLGVTTAIVRGQNTETYMVIENYPKFYKALTEKAPKEDGIYMIEGAKYQVGPNTYYNVFLTPEGPLLGFDAPIEGMALPLTDSGYLIRYDGFSQNDVLKLQNYMNTDEDYATAIRNEYEAMKGRVAASKRRQDESTLHDRIRDVLR